MHYWSFITWNSVMTSHKAIYENENYIVRQKWHNLSDDKTLSINFCFVL